MAYYGEELHACLSIPFDFSNTRLVTASGDGVNVCGHAILNTGNRYGYYFHVAGFYKLPRYMNEAGYQRYLRENRKHEIERNVIVLTQPEKAQAKLDELLSEKWLWLLLPNNCATFVEEVLRAGGASEKVIVNCPALGMWP